MGVAIAPGQDLLGEFFNNAKVEDEDCLYMNAFAPAWEGSPEGRPVVLFIHGGGWQQGDGSIDLSGFAGYEDVVALCFNYRTNSTSPSPLYSQLQLTISQSSASPIPPPSP